jgi:hypothetical protein
MRAAIIFAASILVSSCGGNQISKKDRELLDFRVDIIRQTSSTNYNIDSLKELTNFRIEHIRIQKDKRFNQFLQSHMDAFSRGYNDPYDIKKDRFLTLEKYLEYCKAHKYDPVKYIEFLD